MQTPKVDFKQIIPNAKQGLQSTGEQVFKILGDANKSFDTFVSSKNIDPKAVKQIGMGAFTIGAGILIVASCIKGIVDSIKEKVNEK